MADRKLSEIAAGGSPPATSDALVGVTSGAVDQRWTLAQVTTTVAAGIVVPIASDTGIVAFPTPSAAQQGTIANDINYVRVAGYAAPDDGGDGVYKRVNSLQSPYVGSGITTPVIPPSFASGGVPILVFATTVANQGVSAPSFGTSVQPISAGSLTFIIAFDQGHTPTTATDSAGNTYTAASGSIYNTAFGIGGLYYCLNPVFAPIGTTFNVGGRDGFVAIYVYTVPGFTGATLDVAFNYAVSPVFVPSPSLATGALATQPELVIGCFSGQVNPVAAGSPGNLAYTLTAGWVDLSPPIDSRNAIAATVATSTSGVTFNPTWGAGSRPSNGFVVSFKTFPKPSLDASFWQLMPTYPVHLAQFGVLPVTADNNIPFQAFSNYLATIAKPSSDFGKTNGSVSITIASPAVVTLTSPTFMQPFLRNGSIISFQTTGSLPIGITASPDPYNPVQLYYVQYGTVQSIQPINPGANIKFQITTQPLFNGTGASVPIIASVITSGSQSGTHSITVYGESWSDVVWDPGVYTAGNNMAPGINCGLSRTRLLADGARINTNINFYGGADRDQNANTSGSLWCYHTQFQTTDPSVTGHFQNFVTLITPAQASNFYVNSWVALMAIDMQLDAGANWNAFTFEFLKVQSVDAGTGIITFYEPMQYNYRSTYPKFTPPAGWVGSVDGPGTIVQLNDGFDQEIEVHGLNIYGVTEGTIGGVNIIRLIDCEIFGWAFDSGPSPAIVNKFTMERCRFHNCVPEVDKMIDTLEYIDCQFDANSYVRIQSASVNKIIIDRCQMMNGMQGAGKDLTIRDSQFSGVCSFGPVYGVTNRITLINSNIQQISDSMEEGSVVAVAAPVTFTNGTLSVASGQTTAYGTWVQPGSGSAVCPLPWAVPGGKIVICATPTILSNSGGLDVRGTIGMMKAFTVLDLYMSGGGAFSVDTDLTAIPDTSITVTGSVSNGSGGAGNILNVTAMTPADAYLLSGMNLSGGGLPGGTIVVSNSPGIPGTALHTYTLNNSANIAPGTDFTATISMHYQAHTCPRFTVINCTGGRSVTDMAGAPPDIPMFSYFKRAFAGLFLNNVIGEARVFLAGNLTSWVINVMRAYTGAAASYTCTFYVFGYKTSAGKTYPTYLTEVIDLKTVGIRTITAAGTTGSAGADSIQAIPYWLSGGHFLTIGPALGGGDTLANMPFFTMTGQTDQGIYPSMTVTTSTFGNDEFSDTTTGTFVN
jgi:hypothetical protein